MCSLMLDDAWRILCIKHEVNAMAYECQHWIWAGMLFFKSLTFKSACVSHPAKNSAKVIATAPVKKFRRFTFYDYLKYVFLDIYQWFFVCQYGK